MEGECTPEYPATCPHCHDTKGWPFAAGTCERTNVIVVKLRCRECSHEWTADAPSSVMVAASFWPVRNSRRSSSRRTA
jgi:hypothetical protein